MYNLRTVLTSYFDVSKLQKTISKNNTDLFKPVCQLWTVILNCMRDSKPQRDVQQHKLL